MTIEEILAQFTGAPAATPPPPPPLAHPSQPWLDAGGPGPRPSPRPSPSPTPSAPYTYATPDPLADAQRLEDNRGVWEKLTGPVSPILEVPADVLMRLFGIRPKVDAKGNVSAERNR